MTDPKATPRIADSTCCCCNEDCHAKRIAAEAKIENVGRQLVIETDKRMQAEIRLAAYENNEGMPERPKRYRIETESTEGEFVGAKDYEALRAFAAKQAVDAGKWRAYDERKRRAIAAGQGRSPLRNAAIDAAKGK